MVTTTATIQSTADDQACAEAATFTAPATVAMLCLSLAPFLLIPAAHVLSDPTTATGFFHYELPYYVANGRAAFERGNGLSYPNPYDSNPNAPNIYAHWLPWLFGLFAGPFGFDPGDVILTFTVIAAFTFAMTTRQLVQWRLPNERLQSPAFLLAMWGGGLFALAGYLSGGFSQILTFDPGNGMWFLNWGRNALFPTEAIYHSLVAGCWIAELRNRTKWANAFLILLATTHPWSGLELLLTINLWRAIQWMGTFRTGSDSSAKLRSLLVSVSVLVAFLSYYKIWLPSFPSHAELQSVWELDWSVSWRTAALAWLPIFVIAATGVGLKLRDGKLQQADQFLICAFFVAAGLALHDRILKPVQPIHFTRGYVWMPLFLLAVPTVAAWVDRSAKQPATRSIAMALIAGVAVSDNLAFSITHVRQQLAGDGFHLTSHKRALLLELSRNVPTRSKTVLSDSEQLNYLIPTYSSSRSWLGHHFNTPQFKSRSTIREDVFSNNTVNIQTIPSDVDVIIGRRDRDWQPLQNASGWRLINLKNGEWIGWRRKIAETNPAGKSSNSGDTN